MQIKVYSLPKCQHCIELKEYLKEKKIKFTDVDVSKDENAAREMIKKSKQIGVPVIEIDKKIIIGFNKEKLDKLLKNVQ